MLKAPAALIVAIALIVLPSIYTWYNVVAFWNPYDATGNLSVSVVNEDAGATTSVTGKLNVGDTVTGELQANDALDFVKLDRDTAMEKLSAGEVYAVYIIPDDFTECLVSPLSGTLKSPQLQYFVNEKLGPVSPKITDMGASAIEQTINSTFVGTVTQAAVDAVDEALEKAGMSVLSSQSAISVRLNAANNAVNEVQETLSRAKAVTEEAKGKVTDVSAAMDEASALVGDAQAMLNDVSAEAQSVQSVLSSLSTEALPKLASVLSSVSKATSQASVVADGFAAKVGSAQVRVDEAVSRAQPLIDSMKDTSDELKSAADALPDTMQDLKEKLSQSAQDLQTRADGLQAAVDSATALSQRIAGDSAAVASEVKALDETAQKAAASPSDFADTLFGGVAASANTTLSEITLACDGLAVSIANFDSTVKQSKVILGQVNGVLDDCTAAIDGTSSIIGGLKDDVKTLTSEINLFAKSDALSNLIENGTLNSQNISEFISSPTKLSTVSLYTPNAYGSAMAPLFMNLTFWIGAFMLVIIFRLEVDEEGTTGLTIGQRYLSRLLFFAVFAVLQAVVCCVGTLALGVQAASSVALFGASIMASLAFLGIIFALSVMFRHVGKALCIVLVFAQIPGGSGLYPIEMTSSFFRSIYPFLPFTYGIDAMRESIGGLYGAHYAIDLAVLALFLVGSSIIGIAFTPLLSNVTRMAARQVREGDLYNGETVFVPERPFRYSQVLRALADREGYRSQIEERYDRFLRRYPLIIRAAVVLGVVVPVILLLLLAFDVGVKAHLLTGIVVWLVVLFSLLLAVESIRYSFERQMGMNRMSNERILRIAAHRDRMVSSRERLVPQRSEGVTPEAPADADAQAVVAEDVSPDNASGTPGAQDVGGEGGADA